MHPLGVQGFEIKFNEILDTHVWEHYIGGPDERTWMRQLTFGPKHSWMAFDRPIAFRLDEHDWKADGD